MEKVKYVAQRVREPSSWIAISVILGLFGLPGPVVAALGAVLDVAPAAIDAVAAVSAASAAILLPDARAGIAGDGDARGP